MLEYIANNNLDVKVHKTVDTSLFRKEKSREIIKVSLHSLEFSEFNQFIYVDVEQNLPLVVSGEGYTVREAIEDMFKPLKTSFARLYTGFMRSEAQQVWFKGGGLPLDNLIKELESKID